MRISRSTLMKPRSSTATPAASAPIAAAVRPAADRHQHRVECFRFRAVCAFIGDDEPLLLGLDRRHLGLQQDLVVSFSTRLAKGATMSGSAPGHQLVHHLDDGDLRPERVVDGRHFEADDPAAENEHALRDEAHLERVGRVPDARIGRDEARRDRLGAGRDDRLGEADDARALGRLDSRRVLGEVNTPSPLTTVTLRWRARPVSPVVSRLTTPSFHWRNGVEIDRRARRT